MQAVKCQFVRNVGWIMTIAKSIANSWNRVIQFLTLEHFRLELQPRGPTFTHLKKYPVQFKQSLEKIDESKIFSNLLI